MSDMESTKLKTLNTMRTKPFTMSEIFMRLGLLNAVLDALDDKATVMEVRIEAVVQSTGQRIVVNTQVTNPQEE